jgi:hypothetical protein
VAAACLFSLTSCSNEPVINVTEKSEYLPIDKFIGKSRSGCPLYFDNFPKNLKTRKLYCGSQQEFGNLYYGILEFEGPHGPVPATILTSRSHLPPSGYIFYIHGGPSGSIYAKGGIGRRTVPSKIREAIFECNLALIDIAYAGSMERSFYPDSDGKYAINELKYIIGSFEIQNKHKNLIWGQSFGGPLALFLELDQIPIYLTVPVMEKKDIIDHAQKYDHFFKPEQLVYKVYSLEKHILVNPLYPNFFTSFFENTKFHDVSTINYIELYKRNVQQIVFHELDEKVPIGKYRDELDQIGINYTIIEGAKHTSIMGIEGPAANKAYQPLFDDICERSGWMDWTAADG